jgi:hypothetical protein
LGLYNRPEVAVVAGDVSPTPLIIKKIIIIIHLSKMFVDRSVAIPDKRP